ncbi:MAG: DUF429 domain-containing protein [Oligoflexia bacterium]|nr:DUF429 domain-containing protein [Oligoflexia bacterium]
MCATRISSTKSKARGKRAKNQLKPERFLGLKLGGGKNDRTSLIVLDYYKNQNKLFLTQIYEHIQAGEDVSSDKVLIDLIQANLTQNTKYLCVDFPLKVPKCVTCKLKCPGYEACREKEIVWMWKHYNKNKKQKPRIKIFTPYTQRVSEYLLNTEYGQSLEAYGANTAPLTARGQFLLKRLKKISLLEVNPALSVLRVGENFKVAKNNMLYYKHQVGGDEARQVLLDQLIKRDIVFVYQQDYQRLIHNCDAFEAFFNAYTGFLKSQNLCEPQPKDVPLAQGWIEFPLSRS